MRRAVERERERKTGFYILYFIGLWSENRSDDDLFFFSLVFTAERSRMLVFFKNPAASPFPYFPSFFLLLLPCTFFPHMFHIYTKIFYFFFFFFLIFSILFFSFWCSRHYTVYSLWALDRNVDHGESFAVFIQQYSEIQQHCSRQYIAYSVWKYSKYFWLILSFFGCWCILIKWNLIAEPAGSPLWVF